MIRFRKAAVIFTTEVLLIFCVTENIRGEEKSGNISSSGEIIFLLDTSASMNAQDRDREAIDAIRQAVYSLPSDYRVGLVAYNTDIQTVIVPGTPAAQMEEMLAGITYTGYTNAGEGLAQAVGLFSEGGASDCCIVMLTDGEIDMPDSRAREASRALYSEAALQARERGVRMYIVAIGTELSDPRLHIFDGAEVTDGAIYWEGQSGSLSGIMRRILEERLSLPGAPLAAGGAGSAMPSESAGNALAAGGSGHAPSEISTVVLNAAIPKGASRVRLAITSEEGIGGAQAGQAQVITGQHFAVVEAVRPPAGTLSVSYQTPDPASAQAWMIPEYDVVPTISATYRIEELSRSEKEINRNVPPEYEHYADLELTLVDVSGADSKNAAGDLSGEVSQDLSGTAAGKGANIWEDERFEGMEVSFTVNGTPYTGTIQGGSIFLTLRAEALETVTAAVSMADDGAVYRIREADPVRIEKFPDPEFEPLPDYRPLIAILCALAACLAGLFAFWMGKRTTVIYMAPSPSGDGTKTAARAGEYSGKLNMYVVRNADGKDIPPQTYRLFGRRARRLTLGQILTSCGIKFDKIGADDIILYPGPDHAVIVMDQSEGCTVMRGMEILKKGMGYPVYYNGKITVSFDDEETEMELHYRNLKPGEREEL